MDIIASYGTVLVLIAAAVGFFMAYGIGIILSYIILIALKKKKKSLRYTINTLIFSLIIFHMVIKISIWRGYKYYNLKNYSTSIKYLETAVLLYPKKIGKMHLKLAEMYLFNSNETKALEHALIAKGINPKHKAPNQIIELIKNQP